MKLSHLADVVSWASIVFWCAKEHVQALPTPQRARFHGGAKRPRPDERRDRCEGNCITCREKNQCTGEKKSIDHDVWLSCSFPSTFVRSPLWRHCFSRKLDQQSYNFYFYSASFQGVMWWRKQNILYCWEGKKSGYRSLLYVSTSDVDKT